MYLILYVHFTNKNILKNYFSSYNQWHVCSLSYSMADKTYTFLYVDFSYKNRLKTHLIKLIFPLDFDHFKKKHFI